MRLLGIQATCFLDVALDQTTLLVVVLEGLADDLGRNGDGKIGDGAGSGGIDGVALVLSVGVGLGDDVLGLLVRCLDDTSALGLGILAGLKNDVCRLTAGVGDKLPDLAKLREEYSRLSEEKDRLYAEYGSLKKRMREYDAVKQNIDSILSPNRGQEQDKAL